MKFPKLAYLSIAVWLSSLIFMGPIRCWVKANGEFGAWVLFIGMLTFVTAASYALMPTPKFPKSGGPNRDNQ